MSNTSTLDQLIDQIDFDLRVKAKRLGVWDNHETFHLARAEFVTLSGLWLEFGVFCGRSIEQFSRKAPGDIYGFDCFEGLPEKWNDENPAKAFSLNGQVPPGYIVGDNHSMFDSSLPINWAPWPDNVKLVKGYFEDTLPLFTKKFPGDIALLHIDSDLYSSAKTVFKNLTSRIKPGTIIVFDEINDYSNWRDHEAKAFAEFLIETGYKYEALLWSGLGCSQGCFRITE